MHKNRNFRDWETECWEMPERPAQPARDSLDEGVVGRERMYPDHEINDGGRKNSDGLREHGNRRDD